MLELRTFGAIDLRGPDGRDLRAIVAQPKRLALLVYLAVAEPGPFHRRDTLLGLFWPDHDGSRARAALSRAVHFLRSRLGEGVLVGRGDEELAIESERLACDATRFRALVATRRLGEAFELHRGDFLEGFYLSDLPELERWIDDERRRCRDCASEAARTLSACAEERGDLALAVHWARGAAARNPYDERDVRRVLALLQRSGDRAAAIEHYQLFARRLRDELDVEPSPETLALVASLTTPREAPTSTHERVIDAAPPPAAAPVPRPPVATLARRRVRPSALALAALPTLALAALGYELRPRAAGHAPRTAESSGDVSASVQAAPTRVPATTDSATRDLYLWGRYYWNRRTPWDLLKGARLFASATARDTSYAPAFVGLADSYGLLSVYEGVPREIMPRAKAAALRALALDEQQGDVHASLGYIATWYEWDWEAAERHFARALELEPLNASAHHWRSMYLGATGRFTEALAEMNRAVELEPSSLFLRGARGVRLYQARDYAAAIDQLDRALRIGWNELPAHPWLGVAYVRAGRVPEAIAMLERARTTTHDRPAVLAALAIAYESAGRDAEARALVRSIEARADGEYFPRSWLARAWAAIGDRARALDWLERAYEERDGWVAFTKVDPAFDALRDEPRFNAILAKLRLR